MSDVFATGTSSESLKATEAAIKQALSLPTLTALTRRGKHALPVRGARRTTRRP